MKKFTKAFLATLLTCVMALGMSACGKTNSGDTPSGSTDTPDSTGTTDSDTADTDSGSTTQEVVTLRWVSVGSGMPSNYKAWADNINAYLGEKIGVNLDMEVIAWGDWDARRNVMVSAGSDYDILFTNSGSYNNDVKIGAFLDIGDMIEANMPELVKMMPESYWDACRINGKLYAVPTYKDSSQSEFIVWDKELAASYNIDTKSINTLEGLTPALKAIKDGTGAPSLPMASGGADYISYEYDQMSAGLPAMGVRYDDTAGKVVSVYEQDDIMAYLKLLHSWYKEGIINSDAATKPEPNSYNPVSIAQGWSGAAITTWGPNMGVEAEAFKWGPTIVSNETVRGSLNSISSNCKYPEKALQLLEAANIDSYVRDSLYYGLEGDNWEYTEDKSQIHRLNTDWPMAGYTQATFFTVTQLDDADFNQWDEVKQLNESAEPSVLLGFTFDTSKIDDQLANCRSIFDRYRGELLTGTVDPEVAVPEFVAELKVAGFDEIIAEAQTQVDAFMASK